MRPGGQARNFKPGGCQFRGFPAIFSSIHLRLRAILKREHPFHGIRECYLKRYSQYSAALIALLSTLHLHAQQPPPAGTTEGARISMNQVWNTFPDFVCKERIVSSALEKGKTKEQRVVESDFMTQRKTQTRADGSPVYSIVESRELTAIDGKPAAKNAKMPTAPLLFDGLAANILFVSDAPRYQVPGAENLAGRLSVRIAFTSRSSQEFLQMEFPAAVSSVQIDTQSTETLHVESRFGSQLSGTGIP